MSELLENLVPGTLPHYFVVLTFANFAQADGKGSVINLKDFTVSDWLACRNSEIVISTQ